MTQEATKTIQTFDIEVDDDDMSLASACEMTIPSNNGKWTLEEVEYLLCLVEAFDHGYLPLPNGTTLRGFLAKMLSCKPKRISKRFEGVDYNGRKTFKKCADTSDTRVAAQKCLIKLGKLERRYLKADVRHAKLPSAQTTQQMLRDALCPAVPATVAQMSLPLAFRQESNPNDLLVKAQISKAQIRSTLFEAAKLRQVQRAVSITSPPQEVSYDANLRRFII